MAGKGSRELVQDVAGDGVKALSWIHAGIDGHGGEGGMEENNRRSRKMQYNMEWLMVIILCYKRPKSSYLSNQSRKPADFESFDFSRNLKHDKTRYWARERSEDAKQSKAKRKRKSSND